LTGELFTQGSQCPNCGADLPVGAVFCPACGERVETDSERIAGVTAGVTAGPGGDLKQLVEESNLNLLKWGGDAAEAAFGLGCSLGAILSGLLLVIVFLAGVRNWILLGILAFGATILTTGASAFLALQARANARKKAYENSVKPQINQYLQAHGMTRKEFDSLAFELVPGESPLRTYIIPPDQQEGFETEE
jgi:hypothetical protein